MTGVLAGIEVLDLTSGIAGPMAAMLLGDQGASVTRVVRPGDDQFAGLSGNQVWQRGKRNVRLDLRDEAHYADLVELVRDADVLIESYAPGTASSLRVDDGSLRPHNDRLIHCSITAYGSTGPLSARPGYDALVAARTGHQWEARGIEGTTLARLAGLPDPMAGVEVPAGCRVGADRPGPLFGGIPFVSMGACYLATLGISAALRAREVTGRGQQVETSLLQGALASAAFPWQRVERASSPGFITWVPDPRAPKGLYRCADGRWIHQWVPLPSFVLGASRGDHLEQTEEVTIPKLATLRVRLELEEMSVLHHFHADMVDAVARFPADEWTELAARVGIALQPVRSPEEALDDPLLLDDGCVVELPDERFGRVRQVGRTSSLSACPSEIRVGLLGDATDEVRAGLAARRQSGPRPASPPRRPSDRAMRGPLDGIGVVDLGLAVAGPFGAQLLADLGASVIKVNQFHDGYFLTTHLGMSCNRGKRSIALDLKAPAGREVLVKLVERADVVHHNMRYGAAVELGVDYESMRQINPTIVYSHLRGFERGPRDGHVAGDQTASALCGVEWVDGALDAGGMPLYPITSMGDTGAGSLAAIAIVQALFHRDRTGEGQMVETSLMYAQLLSTSMAWRSADGSATGDRQRLDAMQLGWGPLYRLYETADGWLCIAVVTDEQWSSLCASCDDVDLGGDARFATRRSRREHADVLGGLLERSFVRRSASEWFERLDAAGVPCEITHEDRVCELFDDPHVRQRGWIASYDHPVLGTTEVAGRLIDFSDTQAEPERPSPLVGQHTKEILSELGFDDAAIAAMIDDHAVAWTPT